MTQKLHTCDKVKKGRKVLVRTIPLQYFVDFWFTDYENRYSGVFGHADSEFHILRYEAYTLVIKKNYTLVIK